MTTFIVAVEHLGTDLDSHRGTPRCGIQGRAYDPATEALVDHRKPGNLPPRIGFPEPQRSRNSPARLSRYPSCATEVTALVAAIVHAQPHRPHPHEPCPALTESVGRRTT